jgi:hypothetical protein
MSGGCSSYGAASLVDINRQARIFTGRILTASQSLDVGLLGMSFFCKQSHFESGGWTGRDTRIGGLMRRSAVLLALWQRRNIGKHFGWFSLLTY